MNNIYEFHPAKPYNPFFEHADIINQGKIIQTKRDLSECKVAINSLEAMDNGQRKDLNKIKAKKINLDEQLKQLRKEEKELLQKIPSNKRHRLIKLLIKAKEEISALKNHQNELKDKVEYENWILIGRGVKHECEDDLLKLANERATKIVNIQSIFRGYLARKEIIQYT